MPRLASEKELTLFGEWLHTLRDYLHEPDWKTIAMYAGIDPTTISKGTRPGNNHPKRSTVLALVRACREVAQMKGLEWKQEWETDLFNAAGYASPEQAEQSSHDLATFLRDHS